MQQPRLNPPRLASHCLLLASLLLSSLPLVAQPSVVLDGVIDMHVHAGPDSRPRAMSDWEAARLAREAGLRAIVLKNHFTMTADRAALAMELVDDLEIFGGIALNRAVGGINPEAVRQMVSFSGGRGKVVWLPTFDAEFYVRRAGSGGEFVSVLEAGEPVPGLTEVFDLIAENGLVLAMGHSSPEEVLTMIPLARSRGVSRIPVTHVFGQDADRQQMARMAEAGVVMELDWLAAYTEPSLLADYVDAIQTLGAGSFIISSDFGQAGNPDHATGLRDFISALSAAGIDSAGIDAMARNNPATLLGLD